MVSPRSSLRPRHEPGVLKQAAKLFQAQAKSKRATFSSWPPFVRNTLWHQRDQHFDPSWRKLPLEERLIEAERLRTQGGNLYRAGDFVAAASKYEQCAGLFHYVEKAAAKRASSLEDSDLRLVTDDGADVRSDEGRWHKQATDLRAICYANLAQCLLRQGGAADLKAARQACDEALALDPRNSKALYRRALVNEALGDAESIKAALDDLNQVESLSPGDASVSTAKRRIMSELKRTVSSERRMFHGLFSRVSVGGAEERESRATRQRQAEAASQASNARLEDAIAEAAQLRAAYLKAGRQADAKDMEHAIRRGRARLSERKARAAVGADVLNPDTALYEEARAHGIDLDDPEERERLDQAAWEVHQALQVQSADSDTAAWRKWRSWAGELLHGAIASAIVLLAMMWVVFKLRP